MLAGDFRYFGFGAGLLIGKLSKMQFSRENAVVHGRIFRLCSHSLCFELDPSVDLFLFFGSICCAVFLANLIFSFSLFRPRGFHFFRLSIRVTIFFQ